MKKQILPFAAALSLLAACGTKSSEAVIDYGESSVYSKQDMDAAIKVIKKEFASFEGCELHSISYTDDSCMNENNLEWMNDLGDNDPYTECISFVSDFHSPTDAIGAWEPDKEYEDWQWWLARTEGGEWELLTWGY